MEMNSYQIRPIGGVLPAMTFHFPSMRSIQIIIHRSSMASWRIFSNTAWPDISSAYQIRGEVNESEHPDHPWNLEGCRSFSKMDVVYLSLLHYGTLPWSIDRETEREWLWMGQSSWPHKIGYFEGQKWSVLWLDRWPKKLTCGQLLVKVVHAAWTELLRLPSMTDEA